MTIEAFREQFLPILRQHMERKAASLGTLVNNPIISAWLDHVVHLSQGGKCLRPYLANLFYQGCGGKDAEGFLRVSTYAEIFHLFALVHDDVIDEGRTRHGLPAEHKYIEESLKTDRRIGRIEHIAEGQAILVGDLLLSWSHEIIARADLTGMNREVVLRHYQEMVEQVIIGEMLDVDLCTKEIATTEQIQQKSLLKSGHYSMMHPFLIGASFAGSQDGIELARQAGHHMGLAFQTQDDLLDIIGDEREVGKVLMNDIAEGQHTMFTQHVVEHATEEQQQRLLSFKWHRLDKDQACEVRAIFEQSGAIAAGEEVILREYSEAQKILEQSFLAEEAKQDILVLLEKLKGRRK
jgi:geranylgeranyl diphosphate synthase type I